MDQGYKGEKEAFVSGLTGSSIGHVNLVSLNAWATIALYETLKLRLETIPFLGEFTVLVIPLLGSVTLFADKPLTLFALLCGLTGLLNVFPRRRLPPPLSPSVKLNGKEIRLSDDDDVPSARKQLAPSPIPAVTVYRSHMMLMTIICILAVDFPIFPRSLAKCETFGVSVMDLGVGSFVFSQGLTSALPIVKDINHLVRPLGPKLATSIKKVIPVLALGLIRLLLVKGSEYPEHASEYGTHWNFFLTLALLPPLQTLLHPVILKVPLLSIALAVTLAGQILLSQTGLQEWVLEAPRLSLISHNKEGIVSLLGYLSIHLVGLLTGTLVFPDTTSSFRRQLKQLTLRGYFHEPDHSVKKEHGLDTLHPHQQDSTTNKGHGRSKRKDDKLVIELAAYSILWWTFLGVSKLLGLGGDVSRQLANYQYVLWVAAYNTSFLSGYILLSLIYKTTEAPRLLKAINTNALLIFLLANLLTGIVNLSIKTMYASDGEAMSVLSAYLLVNSVFAWLFRNKRLVKL